MKRFFLLALLVLILVSCSSKYNTDLTPPEEHAFFDEIFPTSISGLDIKMENHSLEGYEGYRAEYGEYGDGSIVIGFVEAKRTSTANDLFERKILRLFERMPVHSSNMTQGYWRASGKDKNGRIWYGWTNENWCFFMHAESEELFLEAVNAFDFIERMED